MTATPDRSGAVEAPDRRGGLEAHGTTHLEAHRGPHLDAATASERVLWSALCHEMRGSMSALCGLTGALQGDALDAATRQEVTDLARRHAEHAQRLLTWASDVATGGPPGTDLPQAPLGDVVRAAVVAADVGPGRLVVRVPERAAGIPVDAVRLQRVLVNLLDNAARHGPPEQTVRLAARCSLSRLHVIVVGGGSSARPVERALRASAPPPGHHGLGLWLVRHLVATMGGRVRARRWYPSVRVVVDLPTPRPALS